FAVELRGLLPAFGSGTWRHLVLPAVALATAPLAQNARLVRAGMLEVLQQDYVRTARAKGVPERGILYRHAFKNAAIPFITVSGLSLGFMLSGAIIIETVFAWPGLGRFIVQAVPGRDFPVIQAGVFVFALIFVALNLLVDLLYAAVDPRVRLGGRAPPTKGRPWARPSCLPPSRPRPSLPPCCRPPILSGTISWSV